MSPKKQRPMIGQQPKRTLIPGGFRATTTKGRKFAPDYRSIVEAANRYLESRGMPLLQQNARNPDGAMP